MLIINTFIKNKNIFSTKLHTITSENKELDIFQLWPMSYKKATTIIMLKSTNMIHFSIQNNHQSGKSYTNKQKTCYCKIKHLITPLRTLTNHLN